jgi:adenylate cyclase
LASNDHAVYTLPNASSGYRQTIVRRYLIRAFLAIGFTVWLLMHVVGYVTIPYVDDMENMLYDSRIRLSAPGGKDDRIVIIAIDEASLDKQGHWPWTRDKLAGLVEQLIEYDVAVVGFDVVFAERDESADVEMLRALADMPQDNRFLQRLEQLAPKLDRDALFSESLTAGPVVLGYYFHTSDQSAYETGELPLPAFDLDESISGSVYIPRAYGFGANLEVLMATAYSAGFVSNPLIDKDGVVRRAPLLHEYKLSVYESLALATAATYFNDISLPVFVESSAIAAGYPPLEAIELAGTPIPIDSQGAVLVPYRGPAGSFPYVSATEVMEGVVEDPEMLKDTIALIGATAPGLQDLRSTPFGSIYPGVEIHANVLAGLLDGNFRWEPAYTVAAEMIAVIVFGLLSALLLPILTPIFATLAMLALIGAAWLVNMYMWEDKLHVLPLAITLYALLGIYVINMVFGYLFEARSRSHMNDLFGQYVPPDLVNAMSHDPQHYSLASEKRELSVLFSDIRDFTSLSEGLDAAELSELMNHYLTPMTRVIHETKGTIDKYIGDAIMAFWGAPVHDSSHASQAVGAALAMLRSLVDLNHQFLKRGWPELRIGIGVNTGPMSVGNMGSEFRRAYTVLGDSVNLGSRLEGLTKPYGVGLIVSETTAQAAPEFFYREIDRVRVKGKAEPVTILEALGLKREASEEQVTLASQFNGALYMYRQQNWEPAKKAFQQLQLSEPDSRLYDLYLQRIAHFQESPPDSDWDGVFTHESK